MDSSFIDHAYQDKAFPIGSGQTISQPFTVAYQTQLLEINKGDKILEIEGKSILYWGDIRQEINNSKGDEILVKIFRENKINTLFVKPTFSENALSWQIGIS